MILKGYRTVRDEEAEKRTKKYWRVNFNEPTWNLPVADRFFGSVQILHPALLNFLRPELMLLGHWHVHLHHLLDLLVGDAFLLNHLGHVHHLLLRQSEQGSGPCWTKDQGQLQREGTADRNGKRQPRRAGSCIIGTGTSTVCSTCWCWTRCCVITFGTWTTSSCRQQFRAESQEDISQVPKGSASQLLAANPPSEPYRKRDQDLTLINHSLPSCCIGIGTSTVCSTCCWNWPGKKAKGASHGSDDLTADWYGRWTFDAMTRYLQWPSKPEDSGHSPRGFMRASREFGSQLSERARPPPVSLGLALPQSVRPAAAARECA